MDAAEELFASFGTEGVSLRSIEAAAGLATAAAQYHFGSKDRLLQAVVLRRGVTVARRMTAMLDELAACGRPATPQDVVRAIATPYLELLQREPVGGLRWARLIARLVLVRDPRLLRWNSAPGGPIERFLRFVRAAFPDVPRRRLETGWLVSFNILMLMLGNDDVWGARGQQRSGAEVPGDYVDLLVEFVASGFAVAMLPRPRGPRPRAIARASRALACGRDRPAVTGRSERRR